MIRASIDLGTNTCLLLVRETEEERERILHDESNVVRLGEGVDASKLLQPQAMSRAEECIGRYVKIALDHGVAPEDIVAVGTAQARNAKNAQDFFGKLKKKWGVNFRTLTGDEEARATFIGAALPGIDPQSMVVMDIGGGSTELVGQPDLNGPMVGKSLDIGAVNITERFLKSNPVTDDEFWKAEDFINQQLSSMKAWKKGLIQSMKNEPELVAVAGTAVTLAMLQLQTPVYSAEEIDGFLISRGDAHRIVEELKWRTVKERAAMEGMEPKRADVILAGALIFWRVMEELGFQELKVSTRGLRYGVFTLA